MTPDAALDLYLRVARDFGGQGARPSTKSKMLAPAARLATWAESHGIADRHVESYLRFRFRSMGSIRPALASVPSDRVLDVWRAREEGKLIEAERQSRLAEQAGTALQQRVRALRVLPSAHREGFRRHYRLAGRPSACRVQHDIGGAYDPRSPECGQCPEAAQCSSESNAREGFDVGALRAGRLWLLPAEVSAAAIR